MDTETLVTEQIESGRILIEELRKQNFDVTAAFWVKTSEEGIWYLYLASAVVDQEGPAEAYRKLFRILARLPDSWVLRSDVKLIEVTNSIAQDVLDLQTKYAAPLPTRYGGRHLGSLVIEEAYIYGL